MRRRCATCNQFARKDSDRCASCSASAPRRVELPNGKLSHACVGCGRWCRDCRHETFVPARCVSCSAPYVDNPPADDGRVYCRGDGCDADAFPAVLPDGVSAYPRLCRSCREAAAGDREEARSEAAAARELDATVGVKAVLAAGTPRPTAPDPLAPRRRGRPRQNPAPQQGGAVPPEDQHPPGEAPGQTTAWARGGFVPREPDATRRARRPSEMGGDAL